MPISTPITRAGFTSAPGAVGSLAFSPASTIQAGTVAILFDMNDGGSSLNTVASVSDNVGGNTWVVDHTINDSADFRGLSVVSCHVVNAIPTSATITITYTGTNNLTREVWVEEVSGLAAASTFDQAVDTHPVNFSSATVGPTGALATASEIVFMALVQGANVTSFTPGSGFAGVPTTPFVGHAALAYQIVSSSAAVTGTMTGGPADAATLGVLAAYKGAPAAPPSGPGEAFASAFSTAYAEDFAESY